MIVDIFLIYSFLKRLVTPFEEWDAYKLGVIDKDGNIILKAKDRNTVEQRSAFQKFDLLVLKLKKLLAKVPGGNSRIASFAAALWLVKEHDELVERAEVITEEEMLECLADYTIIVESNTNINNRYELFEETIQAASNVVSHNNDMGADYGKAKQKKLFRRKIKEAHSSGGYDTGTVRGSSHGLGRGHSEGGYKPKPVKIVRKKPEVVKTINKTTSTNTTSTTK